MTALPARAAVLGAGTIGLPVAILLAVHGVEVTVVVRRAEAAAEAPAMIARRVKRLLELGAIDPDRAATAAAAITATVGVPDDAAQGLIFEAVAEDLDAKRAVLAAAEPALADHGVLVTTTSSLPVSELAAGLRRPERFAAWHWFHPSDLMPLVEIVPGRRTADGVVGALARWSTALGKEPIVLRRDIPGFVANRLQYALLREAYALVEAGICDAAAVDLAVTAGLGPRWATVGPFATMDLAGLDVHASVARELFGRLSNVTEPPATLAEVRAAGARGARAGRGLLGDYSPQRLAAIEDRRDRTLISLRGDVDDR